VKWVHFSTTHHACKPVHLALGANSPNAHQSLTVLSLTAARYDGTTNNHAQPTADNGPGLYRVNKIGGDAR